MTRIEPEKLSARYRVSRAALTGLEAIYPLYCSNQHYFDAFAIEPSRERLIEDMTMLPEGCRREQKHFLVYSDGEPVALLDLIEGYPTEDICYIGLFMVEASLTGRGIGSDIVAGLCAALGRLGFKAIRLAYGRHSARAAHFWTKNGFVPLREAVHPVYGELIVAQREL